MEPEPAALTIPLATLPDNLYIRGPSYKVIFDRTVTPEVRQLPDDPEPGPFLTLPSPKRRRGFELETQTLEIARKSFQLDFFADEEIGQVFGNLAGLERVDFS